MFTPNTLDWLSINTIRTLSIDAIDKANSGHPGMPLGAAPMAYVLWQRHLKHAPTHPDWADRDRFVLSGGHGSMLLYSLLHLTGYALGMDQIKNFRQLGSQTPGHPEYALAPGVDATTGPLGQGATNAVGMAIAERKLADLFNKASYNLVDHCTYALVTDGDLMEGVSAEASSLAGHLRLGKLIYLYDSNDVTLDGPTSLTFTTEDIQQRYQSYGWHVQLVHNGNEDLEALDLAIREAKAETGRPSLIIVKTVIGFGSPHAAGTSKVHGNPLKAIHADENKLTKQALGWKWPESKDAFYVPEEASKNFRKAVAEGEKRVQDWNKMFDSYSREFPELAKQWKLAQSGELPAGWDADAPDFKPTPGKPYEKQATRKSAGTAMNAFAKKIPWLLGGDADLSCSTNTLIKDGGNFEGQTGSGRNIHYGVREHAMAGIAAGMAYHKGIRPFVATFFCFADYMRPSVRLAAMNHLPCIFVWTHDSIGLGEDGPTHQPVEHLMSLRVMPNLILIRPADALEASEAWKAALASKTSPVGLVLTRQNVSTFDRTAGEFASASGLHKGAYILKEASSGAAAVRAILIATGSEVEIAAEAQKLLEAKKIPTRLVSMPSWELFRNQTQSYRDSVLPPSVRARVSIEAGATLGWEKWVGADGISIGVDAFGTSAPHEKIYEKYGLTAAKIVSAVESIV